jgi:hypothetical protein
MTGVFVGGTLLQLHAIWTWRGLRRWLAAAPLLVMAAFILLLPILGTYDPAFHIAWLPILKILFYVGTLFVCLLWAVRGLIRLITQF